MMLDYVLPPEATIALAGLSGALVYCFLRPDRENWVRSIGTILCGLFASFFFTPALCEWRGWENIHFRHAAGFVVGLVGITLCKGIIGAAQSELTANAFVWLFGVLKRAAGIPVPPTPPQEQPRPLPPVGGGP